MSASPPKVPLRWWCSLSRGAGRHLVPEPLQEKGALACRFLDIVDTPAGERMRLVVSEHMDGLTATVKFARGGGKVETLPPPAKDGRRGYMSTVAPAEPHEFNVTLKLAAGNRRESLPLT